MWSIRHALPPFERESGGFFIIPQNRAKEKRGGIGTIGVSQCHNVTMSHRKRVEREIFFIIYIIYIITPPYPPNRGKFSVEKRGGFRENGAEKRKKGYDWAKKGVYRETEGVYRETECDKVTM